MKKNKALTIFIIVLSSICLIAIICAILLNTKGDVNQGKFRVNDLVLASSIEVEEKTIEAENKGFDSISLNLTQSNNISLLIENQIKINRVYIDNLVISEPLNKGEILVYQNKEKDKKIDTTMNQIEIYPKEKEGQIFIELNIDNKYFRNEVKLPSDTKSVTYDGTILKLIDINISDLQMRVKFTLNIVDETGKLNVCKFNFKLPEEQLINNGISIVRKDLKDYKFSIEDSMIKKILNRI